MTEFLTFLFYASFASFVLSWTGKRPEWLTITGIVSAILAVMWFVDWLT